MAETTTPGACDGLITGDQPVASPEGITTRFAEHSSLLRRRQRDRGEVLAGYFDGLSENWDVYRQRNGYFHRTQRALFRTYVPRGMAVLELGCATGDLLAAVGPSRGVGVDISPRMIGKARSKHPTLDFVVAEATSFDTEERFDCLLINNLLEYSEDIQGLLRNFGAS